MSVSNLADLATAALGDKSSRQVGREKDLSALTWVYVWGWSSPSVIDFYASPNRRGVAARLVKKGLLIEHLTDSGKIKGKPDKVLTLTQDGIAEVEAFLTEDHLLPYPSQSEKIIAWHQLRHDLLTQKYTANALANGNIIDFLTPRQTSQKSEKNTKQHDAIWITKDDKKIGIELELSSKWDRDLDDFVRKSISSVSKNGQVDAIGILSHSKAIIDRYKSALSVGANYDIWEKNTNGKWYVKQTKTVPEWFPDVIFRKIDL
jgi:DNA-binding PadR family transcriptional regulator